MACTTAPSLERCYIGKLGISVATMDQVRQAMIAAAQEKRPAYVCVANIQSAVVSQNDAEFCRIQNGSLLTVPDGMPLVWFARMAGVRDIGRVTGPDLMLETLRMSPHYSHTHYFYGDTDATLQEIRKTVRERFPGTTILGTYSPPFRELTDAEVDATVEEINRLRPSFVWVGLGCPKQELWMGRVFPRIESSVLVGVGAAFRFLIGEYRHPPKVLQACGLEGMFWRGLHRPVYCARYYARNLPTYGRLFLRQLASRVTNRGGSALRTPP